MSEPLGSIEGDTHILPVRVYFEDTDTARIVYHARYLHFMERGRTEVLRHIGTNQSEWLFAPDTEDRKGFAVRSCQIDYLKPAVLDDDLEVHTRVIKVRAAALDFEQNVLRRGEVICAGRVLVACMNRAGQATRIPKDVVAAFNNKFTSSS